MDARTGYSVLIKAAAALVNQQFMPGDDPDDYPHRTMSTRKVARMMERPRDNLRGIAINVREGADAQASDIKRLRDGIDACYRMLLAEANAKVALDKAEDMLRELLTPNDQLQGRAAAGGESPGSAS